MQKLKIFMFWCLLIGTLVSCGDKKEDDPTPSAASQDYFPSTAGSTWNYGGTKPYSVTATGNTKVIDGKTYYEMESKEGTTSLIAYLLKENEVYSGIGLHPVMGDLNLILLKANAAVGESWEQSFFVNDFENKMESTIMAKDITKTVAGKEYKNVIHVKTESSVVFMDMELPFATSHYYFAKGVGLILSEGNGSGTTGNQVLMNIPLTSYTIK